MMGDIEPDSLPVEIYNGAKELKGYDPPSLEVAEPQADGKLLYHGSCHCRAVTYTALSEPITSANNCKCSICWRVSGTLGPLEMEGSADLEKSVECISLAIST